MTVEEVNLLKNTNFFLKSQFAFRNSDALLNLYSVFVHEVYF